MVETILFRGNFTHRLGFKPEPMCYKCIWIIHFNELSFPKFHSCPKSPTPRRKRKASRSARHSQQAEAATGVSSFAIDFGVAVARVNLQLQAVWGECEVGKAQKMKKESYSSANRDMKLFTLLYSSLLSSNSIRSCSMSCFSSSSLGR